MRGNLMDAALIEAGRCKAKAKGTGQRCKNRAVAGQQVCRIHGGAGSGRPLTHGRYSMVKRQAIQEKIEQFYNDPNAGDLRSELALLRALLQEYLDRFDDIETVTGIDIGRVFEMVDGIGRLVERIAKILATTALTQAELQLLQVTMIDTLSEFIPEPERQRAFISRVFGTLRGSPSAGAGILQTHPIENGVIR